MTERLQGVCDAKHDQEEEDGHKEHIRDSVRHSLVMTRGAGQVAGVSLALRFKDTPRADHNLALVIQAIFIERHGGVFIVDGRIAVQTSCPVNDQSLVYVGAVGKDTVTGVVRARV